MTHKRDAKNDHPDWQEIVVDGRDRVNDAGHVSKHSDHSSQRGEDTEVSHPASEARTSREHRQTGEQKKQAEAQLAQKFADVASKKAVKAGKSGTDRHLICVTPSGVRLREGPMNARPSQQTQHHTDGRDNGEEHCHTHASFAHVAQGLERTNARWNPDERQKSVDRPHCAAGHSRGEKTWENLGRIAVEHLRIVESCGEKRENAHESERAAYQKGTANPNYRNVTHM